MKNCILKNRDLKNRRMSEPKRVLIGGLTSETGGMESYILNLYRHIDRSRLQFDFVNHLSGEKIAFEDEIKRLGGRVFAVPMLRNGVKEHYEALDRLFKENRYEAVYYQANRKLKNADLLQCAKKYGVPKRILHSHNSKDAVESGLNKLRIRIAEKKVSDCLTDRFACSKEAGEWMFPGKSFKVVKNGVDLSVFDYDPAAREKIRNEHGAKGKKIYGTVGRLSAQKNPLYLTEIFAKLHENDADSVFWHIGGGELEDALRLRIKEWGLEDSYILLGRKGNVAEYLNAMDVLVLPSLYEGFPITLVEAQCSGLRCLVSDVITRSVDLTGNVRFFSLKESSDKWAKEAAALSEYDRRSFAEVLRDKGYDEETIAKELEEYFLHGKTGE